MSQLLLDREQLRHLGRQDEDARPRGGHAVAEEHRLRGADQGPGFRWGKAGKPGAKSDKPIAHGSGFRGINYNLFALAQRLHPHLAVIDGFEGMEGNGPDARHAGRSPRVRRRAPTGWPPTAWRVELMGIDFAKVGYLNYCAEAGLGEADLKKIEIVGRPSARHVQKYKLPRSHRKADARGRVPQYS